MLFHQPLKSPIERVVLDVSGFLELLKKVENPPSTETINKLCKSSIFVLECSPVIFDPADLGEINWNERPPFKTAFSCLSPEDIEGIRGDLFQALNAAKENGRLYWEEDGKQATWDDVKNIFTKNGLKTTTFDDKNGRFSGTAFRMLAKNENFPFEIIS